jgi:hypothetical protein
MAWSGGTFTRTNGVNTGATAWATDAAAGVKILAARHDTHDQDLAVGINQCANKDGSNATGVFQNSTIHLLTSVSGTNTITASVTPTLTAYALGQAFRFIPANTITAAVTININSVGAKNIYKNASGGLVALAANDLIANNIYELRYDGTQFIVTNVSSYAQGADIASASTINLDTATGDYIHVTGTTTITAVTLKQGQARTLVFDGALTFTNGASLILPGGADITTAAGDTCVLRGEASGVVRCISYRVKSIAPTILTNSISGNYNGTLTGLTSGAVTCTVNYTRVGDIVSLSWAGSTGTSNTTALTMTGMPASIWPGSAKSNFQLPVVNNGSNVAGNLSIGISGVMTFGVGITGGTSGFTNSGTKGLLDMVVTYRSGIG